MKHRVPGPTPRLADQEVQAPPPDWLIRRSRWGPRMCLSTKYQVMPLLWSMDHILRTIV